MNYVASITSKRQLTIPVELFEKIGLQTGDKLLITEVDGGFQLTQAEALVSTLAGSLKVPPKLAAANLDEAIAQAKKRHFSKI